MKVLSAEEMRRCDERTADEFGLPTVELMRRAAHSLAAFLIECFPEARRVLVVAGSGNNGGDGLMAAPLLAAEGIETTVLLVGPVEKLKGDAGLAWQELGRRFENRLRVEVIESAEDLAGFEELLGADVVVDALLGTGFVPPLRGLVREVLLWLRGAPGKRMAVDLPSGWPADAVVARPLGIDGEGVLGAEDLRADAVITFTAPRPAHLFGLMTKRSSDPVVVAAIGSPEAAVESGLDLHWAGGSFKIFARPRKMDANKGSFGHVLVVGGSWGAAGAKPGAPAMASLAALRTGAGLVTAAVPEPALASVLRVAPELMAVPLATTRRGGIAGLMEEGPRLEELIKGKSVVVVGPGLGQEAETAEFFHALLTSGEQPLVIDADGLNLLAREPERLREVVRQRRVILTPHPGEMARLVGRSVAEVQADRLQVARDFAQQYGVTLVLKGARTVVAHASGRVAVNTTGNPGMAKGGSGDVLAGMIAAALAQFAGEWEEAVEAAVCLHGLAADLAVRQGDEHSLLASDSILRLGEAFRFGFQGGNGYVWLQGLAAQCRREPVLGKAAE